MQNPISNHRWAPVTLVAIALVCQAAANPANAAAAISNPAAVAIAAAAASPVTAQPASSAAAQPSLPITATSGAGSSSTASGGGSTGEAAAPRHTDAPELAALQAQIALWKARAEIAKYKAEVKRAEDSLTTAAAGVTSSAGVPGISLAAPMPAGGGIGDRVKGLSSDVPRLLSLRAFDGQFNALVDVSGRTVTVQPGDALDGGWKVESINEGGVKLANGKRVRTLRP